jgi:hypothetical protein
VTESWSMISPVCGFDLLPSAVEQDLFGAAEVFFGVDADGVVRGGGDMQGDAVFKETQLFEALGQFEWAGRERVEAAQGVGPVGVEAEVFPDVRGSAVAVVGDCRAGEVKRAPIERGDDLHGVGIVQIGGGAANLQRGDVDRRIFKWLEQRREMLGPQQRFVSLDVDVDVRGAGERDGVDAVGAAEQVGAGHHAGPAIAAAKRGDFVGVGGDDEGIELIAGAGGGVDPGEHGVSGDLAQHFARQPGGGEAGGNDA